MFGITERGDAGLNLTWRKALQAPEIEAAILITKNPRPAFQKAVMEAQKPIIVHITCTGYGGTKLESNVPKPEQVRQMVGDLLQAGFPADRLVLRVDPIIPTLKGIARAITVCRLFQGLGITRLRYSFLDIYPHVRTRFRQAGLTIPWQGFNAPEEMQMAATKALHQTWNGHLESCAEINQHALGCISARDYNLLGIPLPANPGKSQQRKLCRCLGTKRELLTQKRQCPHGCLYCYWR